LDTRRGRNEYQIQTNSKITKTITTGTVTATTRTEEDDDAAELLLLRLVGTSDGLVVGLTDGLLVGFTDGLLVGFTDGMLVGILVGVNEQHINFGVLLAGPGHEATGAVGFCLVGGQAKGC